MANLCYWSLPKSFSRQTNFLFVILFMLLLSSCTHVARKDGPPNFYVDETKVPNAVPKAEPLAKYGNMDSYRVFGKRYYTLKTSKNYEAVGVASWYGTMFHARRTSSGEPYNMLGMTAAHKTLPLPTYVEVTNLKNQRKIIVKVNDRGPFESNRLIDLSYVAAKKLGMIGHGTTLVKIKAIDPKIYNKKIEFVQNSRHHLTRSYQSPLHTKKYSQLVYLQVGAFRNKLHAEKLKQRLITLLSAPVKVTHPSKGKLYRVEVGPIKDIASMNRIKHRLKTIGIKPNTTYGV